MSNFKVNSYIDFVGLVKQDIINQARVNGEHLKGKDLWQDYREKEEPIVANELKLRLRQNHINVDLVALCNDVREQLVQVLVYKEASAPLLEIEHLNLLEHSDKKIAAIASRILLLRSLFALIQQESAEQTRVIITHLEQLELERIQQLKPVITYMFAQFAQVEARLQIEAEVKPATTLKPTTVKLLNDLQFLSETTLPINRLGRHS